jgi:hypothetical protein
VVPVVALLAVEVGGLVLLAVLAAWCWALLAGLAVSLVASVAHVALLGVRLVLFASWFVLLALDVRSSFKFLRFWRQYVHWMESSVALEAKAFDFICAVSYCSLLLSKSCTYLSVG